MGYTFYQYFCWDLGPTFKCVCLLWPPRWPGRKPCQLCWSWRVIISGGDDQNSVSVWQRWKTCSVLSPSHLEPWRLHQHRELASICLAFPVVDNIFLLVDGDLVLWVHQHWLEGVDSFETNRIVVYLNIFLKDSPRPKSEKQILCKTHRSILNCQVRYCNKIIKDLKSQINQIQDKIKANSTNKDFEDITNQITKTKEKGFKTTKTHQIKKFNFLKRTPAYRNTPVPDIKKKWVIYLSSKPLTDGEQSLLQKGPKFVVSSSRVPLTEYIAVTKRIIDELGENTTGRDCT